MSKKLKEAYEYAPKGHLTSAPGSVNQSPDYKSTHMKEFYGIRDFDQDHLKKIRELKSFLSSTTYSIGRKAATAGSPSEVPFVRNNFTSFAADAREKFGTAHSSIDRGMLAVGDESKSTSMSQYINPNLTKNLHFSSPNSTAKDRFATTNIGYTTAVTFKPKHEYIKKVGEDKNHREKMREIVLGSDFEVGFDEKPNCPSNSQKK